jgi:hypothetical protein
MLRLIDHLAHTLAPIILRDAALAGNPKKGVVLVMDSATQHLARECVDRAGEHGIPVIAVPENLTGQLQPMDQAPFRQFKRGYYKIQPREVAGFLADEAKAGRPQSEANVMERMAAHGRAQLVSAAAKANADTSADAERFRRAKMEVAALSASGAKRASLGMGVGDAIAALSKQSPEATAVWASPDNDHAATAAVSAEEQKRRRNVTPFTDPTAAHIRHAMQVCAHTAIHGLTKTDVIGAFTRTGTAIAADGSQNHLVNRHNPALAF